jgi:hypothetical protein
MSEEVEFNKKEDEEYKINENDEEEEEEEEEVEEEEEESDEKTQDNQSLGLRLGDIIEILAPQNPDIHQNTFFIEYIDDEYISLINVTNLQRYPLNITPEKTFTDETIEEISILSHAEEEGYARQNRLLPGTWVELHIFSSVRITITGEITDLKEDQIQIITYPDLKTIYINFDYKGIPKNIPFEKIVIREKPAELDKIGSLKQIHGLDEDGIQEQISDEDLSIEYLDSGEAIIRGIENRGPEQNFREKLHNLYRSSQGIVFLEDLEDIVQLVELPENMQRYSVEVQVNSIVDELLSTIPNTKRTKSIMDRIHLLVERYKELRVQFSKFDENENIRDFKIKAHNFKPIVERIEKLDKRIKWILPVVESKKKIYDIEALDEDECLKIEDILESDVEIQNRVYYDNKFGEANRYYSLYQSLNDSMRPFENVPESPDFLIYKRIQDNLEAIVQNTEDFYSTTVYQANTLMRRFVIENYNLGLSRLETGFASEESQTANATWRRCTEGGKRTNTRVEMTQSDKIPIKSLIILPKPVMQYSKLYLPSTNILDRTNLHQTNLFLFRLLRKTLKNTDLIQHIVDDLDTEIDYEAIEKETGIGFLSKATEYVLEESKSKEPEKFHKFLSTIFPKTKVLIRFIQNQLKNKLSVTTVMDALEPFLVYSEDITYGHYANDIRYFIKTRIASLNKELQEKAQIFNKYKTNKFVVEQELQPILRILQEKPEFYDRFISLYDLELKKGRTTAELTRSVIEFDQSILFTTLLSILMISLRTPNSILNDKKSDNLKSMDEIERIRPSDCSQKVMTKLYRSIEDLMKDNHNDDVFYDTDYDTTPYNIMNKYKDDRKKYLPDRFLAFIEENLVQKHECPKEMANDLAKTLIEGKKRVKDGEYAVVEIKPKSAEKRSAEKQSEDEDDEIEAEARKKIHYFQRKKNVWVQDKDIDETMFIDSTTLLCNMEKHCGIKQSKVGDQCESDKQMKNRIIDDARKKALKEFDRRTEISLEYLRTSLEKELTDRIRFIQRLSVLKDVQLKKINFLEYEYGKQLQLEEIVRSPYENLLELILEQDDFIKKQTDIVRFAARFTRKPILGIRDDSLTTEEPYWLYCKETNMKLLPDFLLILAQEYCDGGDYNAKIDELCVPDRVAVVGNRIVDIHSGRTIKMMDFSTEEGYNDAGFRVSTNAVLEVNKLENLSKITENMRVFKDETIENIFNIISAICKNIDIPISVVEEPVLRISMDLIQDRQIVSSEEAHLKRAAKSEKKQGKTIGPYSEYRNEMIIMVSVSVLIATIQSIQGLKTMKTFPGCVRSFTGYPFDGIEDLSTIEYLSCVLEKMRNPSINPWKSIYRLNRQAIADRIKAICTVGVITNPDIINMFQEKRDYLTLYPDIDFIPSSLQLAGWKQFLPPISRIDIVKHLQPVSPSFKSDFMDLLRKGNKVQSEDFLVLKSKVIQHTFGILQKIQEIVDSKTVLLKSMSNIPFLQNACCNEIQGSMHPLKYFIQEDTQLENYMKTASSVINTIDYVNRISKASSMFDPRRTGIRMVQSAQYETDEETLYLAFINYCGLDRTGLIPTIFHGFFTELPPNYNKRDSLVEKIVKLKKEGKQFNKSDLSALMTIVHKNNIVEKYAKPRYTFIGIMRDILANLDRSDSTVVEEPLRRLLEECIADYSPTRLRAIEPANPQRQLDDLKNYLADTNERMYVEIVNFIRDFGKPKEKRLKNIMEFLNTTRVDCTDFNRKPSLQSWNLDCDMETTGKYYDNGLYTIFNFVKGAIHNMTHVFPEIILNDVNYTDIPAHWGLGKNDILNLEKKVESYLTGLQDFKGDAMIARLLQEIRLRNVDLYLFLSNLPVHTPIVKEGVTFYSIFDKRAILQIILYVFY